MVRLWRGLLLGQALRCLQAETQAFVRWIEPSGSEVQEVPSRTTMPSKVFAWLHDDLQGFVGQIRLCIQADSNAPSKFFCDLFRQSGMVRFDLPIELMDGIVTLTASLALGESPEGPEELLCKDQVRFQKYLRLTREVPSWADAANPLVEWWDLHREGLNTVKMANYFDVYHRHLHHFRGRPTHILEVGVASGGSLQMWKAYFGPQLRLTAVDCCPFSGMRGELEDHRTSIWIGDQADPDFWRELVQSVPPPDIVVDDGGHIGSMQLAMFQSLWPHVAPGGVYIVEDIFLAYTQAGNRHWIERLRDLIDEMQTGHTEDEPLKESVGSIRSITMYRYCSVIEKYDAGQGLNGFAKDWPLWAVGAGSQAPALEEWPDFPPAMTHPA